MKRKEAIGAFTAIMIFLIALFSFGFSAPEKVDHPMNRCTYSIGGIKSKAACKKACEEINQKFCYFSSEPGHGCRCMPKHYRDIQN